MAGDTLTLTPDQLQEMIKTSVGEAIRAVNTVEPDARPAAPEAPSAPTILRRGYGLPRLGKAMKATFAGAWRSSETFERDVTQAAAEIFGYRSGEKDDDPDPIVEEFGKARSFRSIVWPKSRDEMAEVLYAIGERKHAEYVDRLDLAIRAMNEGTGSAGGFLVPTQYLQDAFAYALVSTTAVRQVAGVDVMPVRSNVVALPRESTRAGASQANEAGTLTAQDATLSQQTINVYKQYGYRLYSNELLADSDPAWNEFLARTLVRDVALQQDIQFLEGSGSAPQIQGIVGYSGLTTGPNLGTNGASPTLDHFYDAQYLLRVANAEADFAIAHPRVINSLAKLKDSAGNYLLSNRNGVNAPAGFGTGLPGAAPKAVLLDTIPVWFSSQINIARSVGTSSDCTTVIIGKAAQNLVILERQGIEVAFSEHVAFNTDQTAARAIGRAAVALLQPAAVATITGVRP